MENSTLELRKLKKVWIRNQGYKELMVFVILVF